MKSAKRLPIMLISNIKKKSVCFIVFLLCSFLYNTDSFCLNNKLKPVVKNDSSKVSLRTLPEEKQKDLLSDPDYIYDRVGPAPESLWQKFKDWFWRQIASIFSSKGGIISLRIFEYALIAAAIVTIILLLLKNNVRSLFYGKSASVNIDFSEFEDDIHTISFDEMIAESISKKNFRKAIRLHFLKLLKELSDRNLIQWKIDKTNNDYSIELNNSKYNAQFKELALLYEYVWYGDFQVEEGKYNTMLEQFKGFKF